MLNIRIALCCACVLGVPFRLPAQSALDLKTAAVVVESSAGPGGQKAAELLRGEVERRTGIRWAGTATAGSPVIRILRRPGPGLAAEGFANRVDGNTIAIAGNDERGMLFGAGHFLRQLEWRRGLVSIRPDYRIESAPEMRIRGHQLGYRPKTNSYDGWTLSMWEQYVRDLIVFGANSVELIPPRSDDDADSPHFPRPPMDMMIDMSRLLDSYGLDVWIWYPAMDEDYRDAKTVEFALREWGEVFRRLPRIDHVLIPAGDPGHTPAEVLFPLLEKQVANLQRYHPHAKLWLAPQGFDAASMEYFFAAAAKRPKWLHGVAYGPQTRVPLEELRRRLPRDMPVRLYPDITHTARSQYPVPDWDAAFALTLGREPVNPRPVDEALIFRHAAPHIDGFVAYSEGCNDDFNKALWSALGWKRNTPVEDIVREYGRYFLGSEWTDDFARGLFGLERNWRGSALRNQDIAQTLGIFQSMEKRATPSLLANWRFQQPLYRAYFDAYVQRRLQAETGFEQAARGELTNGGDPSLAIEKAEAALARPFEDREAAAWRTRVFELAEALFQSIRMQLSVKRYQAIAVGRGANLDTLDVPLNSRVWLREQFERIRRLPEEKDRRREMLRLANWSDPGPGGIYEDLGKPGEQTHVEPGEPYASDPQFFHSTLSFTDRQTGPASWWDQAISLYDRPLRMRFADLTPNARYRLRVVYGGGPLRLQTGSGQEIHGYLNRPYEVLEFDLPERAIQDGKLVLEWNRTPGGGGAGRNCQVAEFWLLRAGSNAGSND